MNKNIQFFPDRATQRVILVGQKPLDCCATIGFPPREAGKINSHSSLLLSLRVCSLRRAMPLEMMLPRQYFRHQVKK